MPMSTALLNPRGELYSQDFSRACPAPRNPRGERVLAGLLNEYGQRPSVRRLAFAPMRRGLRLAATCGNGCCPATLSCRCCSVPARLASAPPSNVAIAVLLPPFRPTAPVYRCAAPFVYGSRTPFPGFRRPARPPLSANKIYRGVTAWSFLSLGCAPARWLARRGSSESRSRSLVRLRLCSFYSTGERNERVCV